MATIGIKGTGTIKHHNFQHKDNSIAATVFFDIGTLTSTVRTERNDSTLSIQTNTRIYLTSQHREEGAPLSMAEARIMAPITGDCATLVHLQHGLYRVVQGGTLSCRGRAGSTTSTVHTGQTLHIDSRDTCNTSCIEIGQEL